MTSGEGGVGTTDDADLARRIRLQRNQGMVQRHECEMAGQTLRLTDFQAAWCTPTPREPRTAPRDASLPMHPGLAPGDTERIAAALLAADARSG